MRAHRSTAVVVLGFGLVLAAACGKKEEQTPAVTAEAVKAASEAAPVAFKADCSLLTAADVKEATGATLQGPTLNKSNMSVCEFSSAETGGSLNFVVKPVAADEKPEVVMAKMNELKIATTEHAGVGDRSFWADPGYGMTQLNTFKGSRYAIITLMLPGAGVEAQKTAAVKLMNKLLTRM